MFHRLLRAGTFASVMLCAGAHASTSFQLTPASGALSGTHGSTVGWGFQLVNDEHFLVVTSAEFDTPAAIGSFTDYIAARNFFVVGPGANASIVWAQKFDPAQHTGVGSFVIDAGATPGAVAMGQIRLTYDLFSRSPLDSAFDPDTHTLSTGNMLSQHATVTVVPEPATWALLAAGVALLGLRLYRRSV